jgi:hypothetical protein
MGEAMTCAQTQVIDLFGATKVPSGDKFVRGITVTCGYQNCGGVESLPVNNFATKHTDDQTELNFIRRKLEGRGWKIGNKPDQHRCSKCFAAIKATAARRASENRVTRANGETPVSVSPIKSLKDIAPRMMGREDRRIVFEKLNEVYLNDKVGYGTGWTDERVANDLGVPRAWVKLIRDENFGDEMANEEIKQKVADATKLLDEMKQRTAVAETIVADLKRLSTEAERMNKSLDAIRKAVGG